jgi:hypothetical protein
LLLFCFLQAIFIKATLSENSSFSELLK